MRIFCFATDIARGIQLLLWYPGHRIVGLGLEVDLMDAAHLPAPVHTLTDRLLALDFPFVDVDYPTFFFFLYRGQ